MKNPRANLPANFKKATIEMLLLKLLSEEDSTAISFHRS